MSNSDAISFAPTRPKPRRRWLRFSLRALLLFILLISLPLGWLGMKLANKRAERKLVETIKSSGGIVLYDKETIFDSFFRGFDPDTGFEPPWVARQLGEDRMFSDVTTIYLHRRLPLAGKERLFDQITLQFPRLLDLGAEDTDLDDECLRCIKRLWRLEELDLEAIPIGDDDLRYIVRCRKLTTLRLGLTDVSDAGLNELASLPDLEFLHLDGSRVSAQGVADFRRQHPKVRVSWSPHLGEGATASARALRRKGWMVNLDESNSQWQLPVHVGGYEIDSPTQTDWVLLERLPPFTAYLLGSESPEFVESLLGMEKLRGLLPYKVDDQFLARVCERTILRWLSFKTFNVSDDGLASLPQLRNLEELSIEPVRFSRRGIESIAACKSLKCLKLRDCSVANDDLEPLEALTELSELAVDLPPSVPPVGQVGPRLPRLDCLRKLYVCGAGFDDAAFETLLEMPKLEHLEIRGTSITDSGLLRLADHPGLKTIKLEGMPPITSDGVNKFRELRPDVKIP